MKSNAGNLRRASFSQTGLDNGSPAFTLTELVVVIGVVALLAATLLPALAQSEMKSQAVVCLSNMRQLQRAALLYASDNSGSCPANRALSPYNNAGQAPGSPDWVYGTMAGGGVNATPADAGTNTFYLGVLGLQGAGNGPGGNGGPTNLTLNGSIGPYVKSAAVYHCPADYYLDPTYHVLRVRSCSANMMIGCPSSGGFGADPVHYKAFEKYSDFGSLLDPSQCFEFLDENPVSLNDGWFEYALDGSRNDDWPAVNHDLATSFSFADGHTELHRWQDVYLNPNPASTASGADTIWLAQHGTYKIR